MRILPLCLICLLASVDTAYGFKRSTTENGVPLSWAEGCIAFALNSSGSDDIAFDALEAAVQASFLEWQSPTCAGIQFFYLGRTSSRFVGFDSDGPNLNLVLFQESTENWPREARDVIALTTVTFCKKLGGQCQYVGQILDADIELNGAYLRFSAAEGARANRFDVGNSLTHEVGHLLGFDHTCSEAEGNCTAADREATMYERAPVEEISKRDLAEDDVNAMCTSYPNLVGDAEARCDFTLVDGGVVVVEEERPSVHNGCQTDWTQGASLTPSLVLMCCLLGGWVLRRRS